MSDEPIDHRKPPKTRRQRRVDGPGTEPVVPEMLEDLFRHSPQPFAAGRPDGITIAVNQACCDLIGYSAEELRRLDWSKDLTPPEWREHEAAMLEQLLQTKQPVRYEKEYVRKDGSRVPVELLVYLSSVGDGAVPYFWVSIYDLSERKRAQEQLRQQAAIIDNSDVGVSIYRLEDPNDVRSLRILFLNSAGERIVHAKAEDVVGKLALEAFPGAEPESLERNARVAQSGVAEHAAEVHYPGDSRLPEKYFSVDDVPLGNLTMAILFRDVTERKRVEAELEGLARFPSENPNPVLRLSGDGTILYANEAGSALSREWGVDTGDRAPTFMRALAEEALAKQSSVTVDIEQGERVWSFFVAPVVDSGYANFYGRDITDRKRAEEALRESEEKYRQLADSIADPFFALDRDLRITYWNRTSEERTGLIAESVLGKPLLEAFPELEGTPLVDVYREVLQNGEPRSLENRWDRPNGESTYHEVSIYPTDSGIAVFSRDITERKRAEEELRQANERVEKLLSANVIGMAEFDATKIVSANRALLDMTGYSERDVARGRIDWREITPPEYAERDNRAWREMMEHGECLPYEKEYITRDGKRVPILIAGVRLTEDPVTGVFLNLDITDWKLMERELLETTHYAEHLFESSLIGLTRFNGEVLVDASDAFLDMVGYAREDLDAGLIDLHALTPPEYAALDERAMGEMLTTEEAAPYEKEYVRKDGSRVPVLIGRKLIKESPLEWVAFVLDLTERKRIEADLEQVRTEFLGEISHELKTPLTAIKGCASMALSSAKPPDPAEARELFEVVDTQANRLTDLVGNLLDMTRIEGGRLSIEPEEIELAKIVDEARVIFEHSRYPHLLRVELPPKLPRVRADGRRIVQVLTNLYSNAAKFSSPETPIVVTAEHSGSEVLVHVRDRGAGIPGDKMPLLFQKFAQIHTMGTKGTGLGLFICKGIIEAQGGRIWAESAGEGQGATFNFALPAVAGRPAATKDAKAAASKPTPGIGGRGKRRVVAIDDEPHILRYLEHCLKSANYEVASTTDAFAAAELVKSTNPDIVLLDMRLPGTSGLKVLEEIRQFSSVPVAFITATANREDVARGRQFGDTTWLEKPFSREELLEHVHAILARRRRRKS